MRRALASVGAILFSGIAASAAAASFDDAVAASKRGDYTIAAAIFRVLAEQGDVAAQTNLGVMYESGRGVAQDYAQAAKWYRKAAEQGEPTPQCNLGALYASGRGVPQDHGEAAKWYR